MKTAGKYLILLILLSSRVFSQSYYEQNRFALTSPGAMGYGLYGLNNPAVLANVESPDLLFVWSDQEGKWNDFNQWGLFAAIPNVGFSVMNQKLTGYAITDYKLSAGFGSPSFSLGLGYGWSAGDVNAFNRSDIFTFGALIRPNRYLSLCLMGNILTSSDNEGIIEAAIRPFGNEYVSLFGDYVLRKDKSDELNLWSAGAAIEVFPGIRITGRYFENEYFNIGAQLSFGRAGIFSQTNGIKDGDNEYNIYGIRIGAYDRNPFVKLSEDNKYIDMNLLGGVRYQRYRLFDNSNTLISLLSQIDASENDKSVSGIAINLSGMNINKEMVWELREKLKEFKSSGKHVIVYIDRIGLNGYYLASIADKIIMDPVGQVTMEGYLFGRQYYTGTLDKLGIGFTELRYFKYKSANETFARKEMSDADREQWQAIVDDYYTTTKNDICASRSISSEKFEALVNENAIFLSEDALKNNLVDTLGRWDLVGDIIKTIEGEEKSRSGAGSLEKFLLPDDNYWGEKPEIAVIYALGACAMDEGINARKLVKDVEKAGNDKNIKAIVFRVDSPGGDALASDIVAEALRKAKENKPVIVSQGYVAGSGGYWLSMYGDTIVASPFTITGSIGVIAGWFYNKDFKETIGFSTDYVKKGKYADLLFGMTIPFVGITIPNRDLNEIEKGKAKDIITRDYDSFVSKVAMGRKKSVEEIRSIAQGRVWSGLDGLSNGLVDVIGGLDKAIKIAEEKAGLKDKEYDITEYPQMPLFDFNSLIPKPFGLEVKEDASFNNLLFRMRNNGIPMPALPLEETFYIEQ